MQDYYFEEENFDDDLLVMQEYYEGTRNDDAMEWGLSEVCYDTAFENDYR